MTSRPAPVGALLITLAFFCSSGPSIAGNAADLLAQHRAFVGWQFGDGTFKSLQTSGHATRDGKVRRTLQERRIGALYRRSIQDPQAGTSTESGFTGNIFWATNENGFTRPLLGDSQKFLISENVLFTEATTLLPGTLRDAKAIEGRPYDVVRIAPAGGDPLDLYIDPATGSYRRAVIDPDGTYETTYDIFAYSEAAPGKKLISRYKVGGSNDTIELTTFTPGAAIDANDLHPPKQSAQWTFSNGQPFPIRVKEKRLLLDAKVNGTLGHFILDTGAGGIFFSREFAARANLKKIDTRTVGAIAANLNVNVDRADSIEVGGNVLSNVIVNAGGDSFDEDGKDGALGFDLLAGAIVDLNLDRQQMTIQNPATTAANRSAGIPVVVDLSDETPTIPMKVNGSIEVNATLDSGDPINVLISRDLRSRFGLRMLVDASMQGFFEAHRITGGAGGGYEIGNCGKLDRLTVGPIVYDTVPTCESGSFAGRNILVGLDFLKGFNFIFDYPESMMIFIPRK